MGHDFKVAPGVLIPRPDTELLVETAIAELARHAASKMLDLGTGSGAIAVSVAVACPHAQVLATDRSTQALEMARENAARLNARVTFYQGDWYDALPDGPHGAVRTFDLIVSNPPYIAVDDPHLALGDLRFEPAQALTDGADGLGALRAIIAGAPRRLRPGGVLWVEHGWDQAGAVRTLLRAAGFRNVESRRDLAGIERISGGVVGVRHGAPAESSAPP
jgi:release factor glutamine methyltransferase